MINKRGFASDNNAGIHPEILNAIIEANSGHVVAYGDDPYTEKARSLFKKHFGEECEVFFVLTGTGANVLGLSAITEPYHAIVCTDTAHITVDECGAPEKYTGCKLINVSSSNGKLSPAQIEPFLHSVGFEHHVQPRVISISQSTELGTVYSLEEIKALSAFAHNHGMLLHMDGARLANAVVSLNCEFIDISNHAGVDVLSFGGTKNGMLFSEAVIFFKKELAENFKYIRKQGMQLASKMRFVSAQFIPYFEKEIWKTNASHANRMAKLLCEKISLIPGVKITQPVEANGVFAIIPEKTIKQLQEKYFFYIWNNETNEIRLMTSFDTQEEDIINFSATLKKLI
jgi:threonine aldolase